MREPIPVYIVTPVNYGGVWFMILLALGFLYHLFYTSFSEFATSYWFLKPVLFFRVGLLKRRGIWITATSFGKLA